MKGPNMAALIKAGGEMMEELDKSDANIKVSLVPFAQRVNVGKNQRGAAWLDIDKDGTKEPYEYCYMERETIKERECKKTGRKITRDVYNDGVKVGTETYDETVCTKGEYKDIGEKCTTGYHKFKWTGCMESRSTPYNTQAAYNGRRMPGHYSLSRRKCPQPLTPLTKDLKEVKRSLGNLDARGDTYLPAGLIWGWRTLDGKEPFAEAAKAKPETIKAVLFMTDGANTRSLRDDHLHNGYDKAAGLAKAEEICAAIKADDIQIYTVAYRLPDGTESTTDMLKRCATSPGQAFSAENAAELTQTFKNIASMLDNTRLAY
jgi:hypothetical protein